MTTRRRLTLSKKTPWTAEEDDQAMEGLLSGPRGEARTLLSNEFQISGFRVRSQVARKGTAVTKNYRLRKAVDRLSAPKGPKQIVTYP